jgi:hypothetical protein
MIRNYYETIANIDPAYNENNPSGEGLINGRGLNINSWSKSWEWRSPRSALAARERSGYYYGVKIGSSRPLAKSQQAENNHEI